MIRSRKSHPHRCGGCEAAFEVKYFDDRVVDDRAHLPLAVVDVSCPKCGRTRSVILPSGAERTLEVELDEDAESDEGGGGSTRRAFASRDLGQGRHEAPGAADLGRWF